MNEIWKKLKNSITKYCNKRYESEEKNKDLKEGLKKEENLNKFTIQLIHTYSKKIFGLLKLQQKSSLVLSIFR